MHRLVEKVTRDMIGKDMGDKTEGACLLVALVIFQSADLAGLCQNANGSTVMRFGNAGSWHFLLRQWQHLPRRINDKDSRTKLCVLVINSGTYHG